MARAHACHDLCAGAARWAAHLLAAHIAAAPVLGVLLADVHDVVLQLARLLGSSSGFIRGDPSRRPTLKLRAKARAQRTTAHAGGVFVLRARAGSPRPARLTFSYLSRSLSALKELLALSHTYLRGE